MEHQPRTAVRLTDESEIYARVTSYEAAAIVRTERAGRLTVRPIYLDHHATTPVDPRVADLVYRVMTEAFGNPNSADHAFGGEASRLLRSAASQVGSLVGALSEDVHFTTGSTEAIAVAVACALSSCKGRPLRVAASRIEHAAVLDVLALAASNGEIVVTWIEVDEAARISLAALRAALTASPDLVCVMAANNEVGTIQPVADLTRLAHAAGAEVLVDATQAAGRLPIEARNWGVDYLVLSSHKLYGPKGAGALVSPRASEAPKPPLFEGRRGTPNTPGLAGFGEACRIRASEMEADETRIAGLRDRLEATLTSLVPDTVVNGDRDNRLAGNLHISARGAPNDMVVAHLRETVAISTGAACASGADAPSHVLRAMDLEHWRQDTALRIGLGRFNTADEIDFAASAIADAIRNVRAF